VSTNLTIREQLLEKFRTRRRRRTFAEEDVGTTIAAQVFALRKKHDNMSQEKLAAETEMSQARISVIENPNYRRLNIRTLQRIAKAFDVALIVRFVSFGELLDWTVSGSQKTLAPLSFHEEFSEAAGVPLLKPKDNIVQLPSAFSESLQSSEQTTSALYYSAGEDGQTNVSKSGARDELNTTFSQEPALKMVQVN